MGKKKTWKNIKRAFPLYIMVAPGFLYLLINNYVPMTGIIIAFKHLNFAKGILHSDWAGLSNFEYLFKTPDAALITRNTLLYNFAFIVVNTTVSILIAILLSELRSKTKVKIFQSAVLIPSLISIIIVSYLVYAFLSGRTADFSWKRKYLILHRVKILAIHPDFCKLLEGSRIFIHYLSGSDSWN